MRKIGWGPNLVPDVLYPGEAITAYGFPCGYYDVLVVDETGLECTLSAPRHCIAPSGAVVTALAIRSPTRLAPHSNAP